MSGGLIIALTGVALATVGGGAYWLSTLRKDDDDAPAVDAADAAAEADAAAAAVVAFTADVPQLPGDPAPGQFVTPRRAPTVWDRIMALPVDSAERFKAAADQLDGVLAQDVPEGIDGKCSWPRNRAKATSKQLRKYQKKAEQGKKLQYTASVREHDVELALQWDVLSRACAMELPGYTVALEQYRAMRKGSFNWYGKQIVKLVKLVF